MRVLVNSNQAIIWVRVLGNFNIRCELALALFLFRRSAKGKATVRKNRGCALLLVRKNKCSLVISFYMYVYS